jgi:hypothetical protein
LNNSAPSNSQIISSNNFFYDNEIFAKAIGSTSTEQITYDLPGLYGIDVLGFDGHDYGSGDFNFKGSPWNHIPIIVKGTEEQVIYFNIKDSYFGQATGIKMQAYLNDQLLWEEDISANDAGWQYVKIDLKENIPGTSKPFLSALKTGGERNSLSFGIWIDDHVYPIDIQGVSVWVDDIYMPRTANSAGDNLILDGTLELSNQKLCDNCYWFDNGKVTLSTGAPQLSINSIERRSGSSAMYLEIPYSETTSPFHSNNNGLVVASIGTYIDNTDLLTCYDYWTPDVSGLVPLGGYSNVDFEPFPGIVDATYDLKKFWVGSSWQIENGEKLTLNGCALAMSPGTEIVVKDGGVLEINVSSSTTPPTPTYIFSCDAMWQGIIVEPGGEVNVIGNSSLMPAKIQNAIVAIQGEGNGASSGSPKIFVNLAEFDNNLTAIALEDDNYSSSMIQQSFFRCSSQMMNKAPHLGVYPEYHILLNEATSVVMGGGPSLNEFEDVFSGIRVNKSSLNIQKSLFKDLMDNSVSPSVKGIGIVASNTTATAQTIEVDSRFENLNRGMQVSGNFNVDVHDNFSTKYFRDIDDVAIFVNSMNYLRDISVVGISYFRNCNIGILLRGNNWNSVNISGNEFDNTNFNETRTGSFHNTAITCQSPITSQPTDFNISDNDIIDYRIGIHCRNISGIKIGSPDANISQTGTPEAGNTITFNTMSENLENRGIWVQNCMDAQLNDNIIFNVDLFTSAGFSAIEIADVVDGRLRRNVVGGVGSISGIGLLFRNSCLGTLLECNSITGFKSGIHLVSSYLPQQGDPPSTPTGIDGFGWKNEWYNIDPDYRVVGTTNNGIAIPWYHTGTSSSQFSPAQTNTPVVSPKQNQTNDIVCEDPPLRIIDRDRELGPILADTINYSDYQYENKYFAQKLAFEQLNKDTSLLSSGRSSDSLFTVFYTTLQNSNLSLLKLPTKWDGLSIDSLYTLNQAINDSIEIESRQKLINSIYLYALATSSSYSTADTSALTEISLHPTAELGESVYESWAILFKEVHEPIPELRLLEAAQGNINSGQSQPQSTFTIFPNPAYSHLNLVHDEKSKIVVVELYDLVGKLFWKESNPGSILNIQWLEEGIYIVRVYDASKQFHQKKFVKIK